MVFKIRTLSLPIPRTQEDLFIIHGSPLKRFTWRELKAATNNFSDNNVEGRGGFGSVYRGLLSDGSVVAVKRRKKEHTEGGELQFRAEVEIGGCQASDHRNVIRLRGYCITRKERLLVYPFMENKSVASRLRERQPSELPLDWDTRKRVALGVAKGLAHFHSGSSSFTVIHRDVKANNILLDHQFEPILCDFGLAKFVGRNSNVELSNCGWAQRPMEEENEDPFEEEETDEENNDCFTKSCWNFTKTLIIKPYDDDEAKEGTKWSCWMLTKNAVISTSGGDGIGGTIGPPNIHDSRGASEAQAQTNYDFTQVTTAVRGTIGHIAPEYLSTGKCSVKNDVYGYGIMLLELVTGQRAFDLARLANDDDAMLLDWVQGLMKYNRLEAVVDSDLRTDYVIEEIQPLIQISLLCTRSNPLDRPLMSEVIKMIENIGKRPSHDQLLGGEKDLSMSVQRFSLHQLKLATDNFSKKNIMGRSGFSNVYRGRLQDDGSLVIVKRLVTRSKRGRQQFRAEVRLGSMITKVHPNLLQLRGYYNSAKEMLLVYPLMAHRSLEWSLRPERSHHLGWPVRMRIALGTAKGIAYLHNDCEFNTIIHRDVKPSKILLDDNFNPVLCNLKLQSNDSSQVDNSQDLIPHQANIDENQVSTAVCLAKNDVYGYGITLLVLVSGQKLADLNAMAANDHDNNYVNDLDLHNWFKKKLRQHQLHLLVDSNIVLRDSNYDTMYIKDEIEQLVQVALLCTQPSPMDRPEMSEVIKMIEGISQGDLKVCFAFDRANLFLFDSTSMESPQPKLPHEFELGATLDLPTSDTEGSVCAEFKHTIQVELKSTEVILQSDSHLDVLSISKQDTSISSKGKQVASSSVKPAYNKPCDQQTRYRSHSKGISISDNKWEPKMHDRWKVFLSEIVKGALPTKSKLCQSGMSVDPLCPFCNEYEEDNFHLFFNCDFSKQAWQLAMGLRIDMLGFGSVKEAVDVILKPGARVNIPSGLEPSHFSDKGVAVMYSIWNHRNKVCFEKVPPNVKEVVSLSQNHFA